MAEGALGTTLAGCRLESVAGRGGMGVVYRATQLALQRSVALKAMAPALAADDAYRERFQRESQLAASIDHPNVIPVYEAGEFDGTLYLIMRWVDGTDLRRLLKDSGRLEPGRAVRLLRPVASALAAAHRRGLVHRDVKPANVLIARGDGGDDEHVYLTDFGIARRTDSEAPMTRTGVLVGTIDYLAPERIEGGRGTPASDIYSFGCMLFESLSGRLPYQGPTELMRMHAHIHDPVPALRDAVPGVPERLDQIVAKAMAKRPEDRFESAAALAAALSHAFDPGAETELEATALESTRLAAAEPPATELMTAAETPAQTPAIRRETPATPAIPITPPAPPARPRSAVDDRAVAGPKPPARRRRSRGLLIAPIVAIAIVAIAIAVLSGGGGGSTSQPTVSGQTVSLSTVKLPAGTDPGQLWADGPDVYVAGGHAALKVAPNGSTDTLHTDGVPTDIAVDKAGRVWVTETQPNKVLVFQGAAARGVPLPSKPSAIALSPQAAWIAGSGSNAITRVDMSTLAPSQVTVPHPVAAIGEAYGRLWVASPSGALSALDESGKPTLPGPQLPANTIAVGHSDGVWFMSAAGSLTRVDPRPSAAVGGHYMGHPNQFAVADPLAVIASLETSHLIWVGTGSGAVMRIATSGAQNNHAVTTINFHVRPGQLAVRGGVLWVSIPSRDELYRVTFS